jgi:mannose-1-phosphate guanylyltransferase
VGTPAALVEASKDLVLGVAPSPAVTREPAQAHISDAATVDERAKVSGGSLVADRASVGQDAVVSGSVLMDGVVVEPGAVVTDSVLGPGAVVGGGAQLLEVTLGDEARVAAGARLDGERVDCGESV